LIDNEVTSLGLKFVNKEVYQIEIVVFWVRGYRVLVGRPEGKRPMGRPRRITLRWTS
jgi:hypothetical protein